MQITKKIFFISTILFLFSVFYNTTYANIFPTNAISLVYPIQGSQTITVSSTMTPKTILAVQMMQSNVASDTILKCGTTDIFYNKATTTPQVLMNKICSNTLTISKTGNDLAYVYITYVDYDISGVTSTIPLNPDFSSGDLVNAFFSFLIIIFILIYFLRSAINSVPVVRRYQGNNSPDGKEFYDI